MKFTKIEALLGGRRGQLAVAIASCLLCTGGVEALGWTSAGGWLSLEGSGEIPEFGVASAAVAFWHVPSTSPQQTCTHTVGMEQTCGLCF